MKAHRQAGAALFNGGRYADARAVWEAGHQEHGDPVCAGLGQLATVFADDPAPESRIESPTITDGGDPLDLVHLDPNALATAAAILTPPPEDDSTLFEEAAAAATEDTSERYRALLLTVVQGGEDGALARQRLAALIDRRRGKVRDVAGLFDPDSTE